VRENISENIDAYAGRLDRNERKIRQLLGGGTSWKALIQASPIYGQYPYTPDLMRYWEGLITQKHLDEMLTRGTIRLVEGRYKLAPYRIDNRNGKNTFEG